MDAASLEELNAWSLPEGIEQLLIDLAACDYVSSAGLRTFMRWQRLATQNSLRMTVTGANAAVYEVFELTGLNRLIDVRRRAREVSIDGLELLSAGVCGQCFRLDEETVLKLYNDGVGPEVAEQEKRYARAAFIAGVPTALSYDLVRCGTRTGVVYEMLAAEQFSALIRRTPEAVVEHAATLASVAHAFHSRNADPVIFPDLKERLLGNIRDLTSLLSPEDVALLESRLARIPEADSLVHFDLHTSNIMIRDGEPVIIDMGDVSRGHYLFDLGLIALIYGFESSGSSEFVTKIPGDLGRRLYDAFLDAYFAKRAPAERAFFAKNEAFLASLRLINAMAFLPDARADLLVKVRDYFMPRIRAEAAS
jgi:uncharacterized protein (TIGR02172 family)